MSGKGQGQLSDWWIDKGKKWGMDPERLFAAYYNQGDFRLWGDIESRLQATGQPEPIEPKKCVNCQRPQEIGCCEKFEYDRMVGLGLIEGVTVGPDAATQLESGMKRRPISRSFLPKPKVSLPKPALTVMQAKAWLDKMVPCALCDSKTPVWIGTASVSPNCGCSWCGDGEDYVAPNYVTLVEAWNDMQAKIKANIAGETPEISENKPEGVDALLPRTWPGVVSYEVTHDVEGPTYSVSGINNKGHRVSLEGYRVKALYDAWLRLYHARSFDMLAMRHRVIKRRMHDNDCTYYGVTSVDVTRKPVPAF